MHAAIVHAAIVHKEVNVADMIIVVLEPQAATPELFRQLDQQGLIRLFTPLPATMHPAEDENLAASIYESAEAFGPHKLISVGVNRTTVRLGVHPENEEFLLPPYGAEVKPLYLIICHLAEDEVRRRDAQHSLQAGDFTCVSLYPSPRGAEMFTMPAGVVHCEATLPGAGAIGCFFVTESRDLTVQWVDLAQTTITVAVQGDR